MAQGEVCDPAASQPGTAPCLCSAPGVPRAPRAWGWGRDRLQSKGTFPDLSQPETELALLLARKEGAVEKMNTVFARTSGIVPLLIELQFVEI